MDVICRVSEQQDLAMFCAPPPMETSEGSNSDSDSDDGVSLYSQPLPLRLPLPLRHCFCRSCPLSYPFNSVHISWNGREKSVERVRERSESRSESQKQPSGCMKQDDQSLHFEEMLESSASASTSLRTCPSPTILRHFSFFCSGAEKSLVLSPTIVR